MLICLCSQYKLSYELKKNKQCAFINELNAPFNAFSCFPAHTGL